jgi:8-oxo-dGTP diphosphatase
VRRARAPADGVFSLPGGVVEAGETLTEAVKREIAEETARAIEPVALAGYREVVARDAHDKVQRHFVILPFAARWIAGEPKLNEELSEFRWVDPVQVAAMHTTPGLAEIVESAVGLLKAAG